tara:strand:- start:91 stop:342 length:252 start_codon:yes stop_codon:yes gene_type:complete
VSLQLIHITDIMVVVDQVDQVDLELTLLPPLLLMVQHQDPQHLTDHYKVIVLQQILVVVAVVLLVTQAHQETHLLQVQVDQEL